MFSRSWDIVLWLGGAGGSGDDPLLLSPSDPVSSQRISVCPLPVTAVVAAAFNPKRREE